MLDRKAGQEIVKRLDDMATAYIEAMQERMEGGMYGVRQATDEEFIAWFEAQLADPDQVAALLYEYLGQGKRDLRRYNRLRPGVLMAWFEEQAAVFEPWQTTVLPKAREVLLGVETAEQVA